VSDRRRAALILLLASTAACPGAAPDGGASLLVTFTFKRPSGAPAPEYLMVTWAGEGNVFGMDRRVPADGTLPDAPVLGTFEISVRQPSTRRTIVARGLIGEQVVAEGAAQVMLLPDAATAVTVELFAGRFDDADSDGIPDPIDNCPFEANAGQGPCQNPNPVDAGEDAGVAPDTRPPDTGLPPPDTRPPEPDLGSPPDVDVPGQYPRGHACIFNDDCADKRCVDSRVGHFCASPGMVVIPSGPFMRGCLAMDSQCQADEQPLRTITLSGFEIDQTEVIQSQYDGCVKAGMCAAPSGFSPSTRPNNPVSNATWAMASGYCKWAGKRLPTEAEWEKAARGPAGTIYPWGNGAPGCSLAQYKGCGLADTVPVGQLTGNSGYGVEDLAGNVAEWVSDNYGSNYYMNAPATDPTGPPGGMHIRRGGGFTSDPPALRTSARLAGDSASPSAGFRCARGL
jgi:hypothetical protein